MESRLTAVSESGIVAGPQWRPAAAESIVGPRSGWRMALCLSLSLMLLISQRFAVQHLLSISCFYHFFCCEI